ncbi:hypothetical protein Ddye_018467 [Dipteronia dyeriana]|uniref:Reverse transcriptase domain-containing protein n=1 Tax=Dipteronia dyeriana TaxID=168575 RepID=A0AAD9UBA1_9ROSI|nr:hypothetical protein Ddye_018467 [Dipteronia dyeriana]
MYSQLPLLFPNLNERDISCFSSTVCENEIKPSLFNIGGIKTPGPDGYQAIFFQKFWKSCKHDLINIVSECFNKSSMPSDINHTLISLIHKVSNPASMIQFRLISLCNTTYKILVQRLRVLLPTLVSPNQVAFVPSRQIQYNIVIAQEDLHKFKIVKDKKGYIAWKIDLTKVYDKLQ